MYFGYTFQNTCTYYETNGPGNEINIISPPKNFTEINFANEFAGSQLRGAILLWGKDSQE